MKKSEHIWRAVQDKNISYKEKQNLADILRHRNKLDKLNRRLRGNKARKRTSVILRRISGAGVFPRHPDTIVRITPDKVDEAFAVEMMLRNHPPQEPFVVHCEHPLMAIDIQLVPAKTIRG